MQPFFTPLIHQSNSDEEETPSPPRQFNLNTHKKNWTRLKMNDEIEYKMKSEHKKLMFTVFCAFYKKNMAAI